MSVRTLVALIGVAFTAYLAARGLWWTGPVDHPWILPPALGFYLVVTWLWIFWRRRSASRAVGARASRLPLWGCVLAIAAAIIVPNAVMFGVGPESRTEPFATWVIGGIGALMTIVMARRRVWTAWIGTAILAVETTLWIGLADTFSLGMIGSIVWVGIAQLLNVGVNRAALDTAQLAELQQAASAWQSAQLGRQRERRVQVQRALSIAGPVLGRTIEVGGNLRGPEKLEARLAEGRLRDELRGPRLLDDAVRTELEGVRRRGVQVTLFDEGGLDGLDAEQLALVRAELAGILRTSTSTRLIIRTSAHERVVLTIVGRSGEGESLSDEDSVDLWHEIQRP